MISLKNYLVEFIGTFFLVFTVGAAVVLAANNVAAPIAIGFALMVMVYAGGHISGGHYNPAVSLAAAIRGALEWKHILQYWIAQSLGAVVASCIINYFATETIEPAVTSLAGILVGEFLFTFALCYVVLQVATTKATSGNSYFGLAIGSIVTVGAFATSQVGCLGAFNPAVALGLGVMNVATISTFAIIIVTNLVAGIVAAFTFKFVNGQE